jgi:hypothetical protein
VGDINILYSSPSIYGPLKSGEIILTAPSYQSTTIIPDLENQDSSLFSSFLHKELGSNREYQRHRNYDGQEYAILQMARANSEFYLLVLESVETSNIQVARSNQDDSVSYRRVALIIGNEDVCNFPLSILCIKY